MATKKQKAAARRNIKKARKVQGHPTSGKKKMSGLGTAKKNRVQKASFAFPEKRKEPLTDAGHVRNAIARFDQVEDVTDAERDKAWKRIRKAAKRYGVKVSTKNWRKLAKGGKSKKR
jgi:hypothetical protein